MRIPASGRGQTDGLGVFLLLVYGAVTLVVVTVILLIGMQFVGATAIDLGSVESPTNDTASPDPITGSAVSFEDTSGPTEILEVYRVEDSTGTAIRMDGSSDSFYQSQQAVTLAEDDTWSASTWARVQDGVTSGNRTALSVQGRVLIQHNATSDEWVGWYYDDGTGDSYRLTAAAPDQPGNLTLVTLTANATHVVLYRNASKVVSRDLSTSAVEDPELGASNWNGTVDETRLFDDYTSTSMQSVLHSNPVAPRPQRDRTARITFDEGSGDSTAIYFSSTRADVNNIAWVAGLAGHELSSGSDYTLDQSAGEITAVDGGRIDGAPVVWISYRYEGLNDVGETGRVLGAAFGLFGRSLPVVAAVAVLATIVVSLVGAVAMVRREVFGWRDDGGGNR